MVRTIWKLGMTADGLKEGGKEAWLVLKCRDMLRACEWERFLVALR